MTIADSILTGNDPRHFHAPACFPLSEVVDLRQYGMYGDAVRDRREAILERLAQEWDEATRRLEGRRVS